LDSAEKQANVFIAHAHLRPQRSEESVFALIQRAVLERDFGNRGHPRAGFLGAGGLRDGKIASLGGVDHGI